MLKVSALILAVLVQISANSYEPKIIDGFRAKEGQFPFSVSLKFFRSRKHFCGAAIISKRWLLTAAHCIRWRSPSMFVVYVGSIYLDRWGQIYYVEKTIVHPGNGYVDDFKNDIGMVKVEEDLTFDENVQPIHLPVGIRVKTGDWATAAGWGDISFPDGDSANQLRFLTRKILSNEYCNSVFGDIIDSSQLCFGADLGHGLCHGDSGSPLVCVVNNKSFAIGIVSYGLPCAVGYPDVYSRVSYYISWILKEMYRN